MWPDLVKFRRFGKILCVLGQFLKAQTITWQNFKPTLANCYAIGQVSIIKNGPILKNNLTICSHCSPLVCLSVCVCFWISVWVVKIIICLSSVPDLKHAWFICTIKSDSTIALCLFVQLSSPLSLSLSLCLSLSHSFSLSLCLSVHIIPFGYPHCLLIAFPPFYLYNASLTAWDRPFEFRIKAITRWLQQRQEDRRCTYYNSVLCRKNHPLSISPSNYNIYGFFISVYLFSLSGIGGTRRERRILTNWCQGEKTSRLSRLTDTTKARSMAGSR